MKPFLFWLIFAYLVGGGVLFLLNFKKHQQTRSLLGAIIFIVGAGLSLFFGNRSRG